MNKEQYSEYQSAVEHNLKGLNFVSTGACPGCEECGFPKEDCQHDMDCASEPCFSWAPCDSCGSSLGGDRHPAHGRTAENMLVHLQVCTDCLYYLNYGQLDDSTMLDIEQSN